MEDNQKYAPHNETDSAPQANQAPMIAQTATASPSSGNSALTTVLIIVIVVLLAVMLMLSKNGKLLSSSAISSPSNDLSFLQSQNAEKRAEVNALRISQGLPPLPEKSGDARLLSGRIQRDATSLSALIQDWQSELDRKNQTLVTLQNDLNARDANTEHLYSQIADLQNKLNQAGSDSSQLATTSSELDLARQQLEDYRNQLATMQGRPSSEQYSNLLKEREELQSQVDALLEQARGKIDSALAEELQAELAKLRPELNSQRYEIQRLRALLDRKSLFIESESDLPAAAARLFTKLRSLEEANPQQLEAAYQNISTSMGAEVIHRQNFEVGSAQITFDREKIIQEALKNRQASGSYFLVVGYASQSGGAANNQTLSANRSTTVASVVNTLKAADQKVQAVYLGETSRFSRNSEPENQICEVWEIKK